MAYDEEDVITPQTVEASVSTADSRIVSTLDSDITQTPEKSDRQIPASNGSSSDEIEYGALGFPTEPVSDSEVTVSPDESQTAMQTQRIALEWNQLNKLFAMGVTEEERAQGFRWLSAPNARYLGFVPRKKDKRKYLNALPLIDADAKPTNDFDFHLPISTEQRCGMFVFFLVFAAIAVGVVFYLRSVEQAATSSST